MVVLIIFPVGQGDTTGDHFTAMVLRYSMQFFNKQQQC